MILVRFGPSFTSDSESLACAHSIKGSQSAAQGLVGRDVREGGRGRGSVSIRQINLSEAMKGVRSFVLGTWIPGRAFISDICCVKVVRFISIYVWEDNSRTHKDQ